MRVTLAAGVEPGTPGADGSPAGAYRCEAAVEGMRLGISLTREARA